MSKTTKFGQKTQGILGIKRLFDMKVHKKGDLHMAITFCLLQNFLS
jgi:hypothetical protein